MSLTRAYMKSMREVAKGHAGEQPRAHASIDRCNWHRDDCPVERL